MCYVEGFCEQAMVYYPFSVQGYTEYNGPGLFYHQITKVVFYYEENGQIFSKSVEDPIIDMLYEPVYLISVEPPKKPIKAVVYYK